MKSAQLNVILAGMLWASFLGHGQTLSPEITGKVDKVFEQWDKPGWPGCALGIYRGGQIVYKRGYGLANLNDDVPITPATVFHVASMSKQFTAASILLLAQQGKLSLDDDVHKYIPELTDFGERITLRNMLHHTSGLRDQWALLDLAGWRYSQDLITNEDVMSVVARQKELNFKPGEKYMYSNTGFTLLAIIVERVSGMSLGEFTTKNIFEPLGMTHTHFRDDHEEVIKHDALGYELGGNDKPFRMNLTNFDTVGATSLHTTVEDLQLWDENFYHPRVGGPVFLQQMLERGKLNNGQLQDYASGLVIGTYRGLPTVDHNGGDAGYRSDLTRFPEQHFSAAVLCNFAGTNPTALVRQVADIVLAKDLKSPAPGTVTKEPTKTFATPLTAEQMSAIAGTYWSSLEDDFATVVVKDGKPQMDIGVNDLHELKQFAPAHFRVAGVPWSNDVDFHFIAGNAGRPRRLEQTFNGDKPELLESVTSFDPTASQMAEYQGAFVSEEIDPIYHIQLKDGSLSLSRLKHKTETLRPVMRDVFVGDIGALHFTRSASQQISGFVLNGDRIRNFRFTMQRH
jgi:CubicO group peptidase (beta-lactamase class C family)